jgi:hypothetical protein
MTLTKLYYLAEGMEFTLIAEMDGYAPDELWIDDVTWNKSEYSDAENDAITLFTVKHKDGINRDFLDLAKQERKDAEDSWAERDCY